MKKILAFMGMSLTWWSGVTVGVWWWTRRRGELVGEDARGTLYWRDKKGEGKRWATYKGEPDAAKVPPRWRMWLHGWTSEAPEGDGEELSHEWCKGHEGNLTGTSGAHAMRGSLRRGLGAGKDYEAWSPEGGS